MDEDSETDSKNTVRSSVSEKIKSASDPIGYMKWALFPSDSDPYNDEPYPQDLPITLNVDFHHKRSHGSTSARTTDTVANQPNDEKSTIADGKPSDESVPANEEEMRPNPCPHSRHASCSLCKLFRSHSGVDAQLFPSCSMESIPEDPNEILLQTSVQGNSALETPDPAQ